MRLHSYVEHGDVFIGKFLKGNCSENFLLQNIFGFHVYITNIYVKLSTETVIMPKNNFEQF